MTCLRILVVHLALMLPALDSIPQQKLDSGSAKLNNNELVLPAFSRRGPTCGIRSLYVAIKASGSHRKFENLVSKQFVGSDFGSTTSELIAAAKSQGFDAASVSHLSYRDLQRTRAPVLLHMRSSGAKTEFDHWTTFLGWSDGKVRIFDPEFGFEEMEIADLVANWSGNGVVLSKSELKNQFVFSKLEIAAGIFALFLLLVSTNQILVVRPQTVAPILSRSNAMQLLAILTICIATSLAFHCFSRIGFINNTTAIAEVARRYGSLDFPEIKREELAELDISRRILIDARPTSDYQFATIDSALNIPVNSSLVFRKQALSGVDREKKIVVFCQSVRCTYSDEIAQFLKFNGFLDVVIYRDGFEDWVDHQNTAKQ